MTVAKTTLCTPDRDKTCFACCPPIRPAGYEHLQHENILKREFRENTLSFKKEDKRVVPITGFSCWALGYLDKSYRRIGCLLHPFQNEGTDLRFRVDYGEKCRRESCPESVTFSRLKDDAKRFWLHLADGLDAFAYSSRKENPLFTIMAWGTYLLDLIPSVEGYRRYEREVFLGEYPFFQPTGTPRAHAYLAKRLISEENVLLLKKPAFREEFLRFSYSLSSKIGQAFAGACPTLTARYRDSCSVSLRGSVTTEAIRLAEQVVLMPPQVDQKIFLNQEEIHRFARDTAQQEIAALPLVARNDRVMLTTGSSRIEGLGRAHPVHRLPLDGDFLDFLRLSARITKISREDAVRLKALADEEVDRFCRTL